MSSKRIFSIAVLIAISPSLAWGQATEIFEWTGGGTAGDWFDTTNWTVIESPIGLPVSINPAPNVPDFSDTRTHVVTTFDIPVLTSGTAEARSVRLGREEGAGQMDMSGGTLSIDDKLRIGNHKLFNPNSGSFDLPGTNAGTFNMSGGTIDLSNGSRLLVGDGSPGVLNINENDGQVVIDMATDFRVDFGSGFDLDSVVNISGDPEINVGDDFELGDGSVSNFDFTFAGGQLSANDDFQVRGGTSAELKITGGLMEAGDELDVDSLVSLSGTGTLRASVLSTGSAGTINVNDTSKVQLSTANTDFATVLGLINSGFFTTDGPGSLGIQGFVDSDFFGVAQSFYQVSLAPTTIPEPTSFMIAVLGLLGLARRKKFA